MTAKKNAENDGITNAERAELSRLITARARVTKNQIDASIAVQLAQFERQMATIYNEQDAKWEDLSEEMRATAARMNKELKERCRKLGITPEFRPIYGVTWYGRGENADKNRRAELRRVAETTLEARRKAARVAVDYAVSERLGELTLKGMHTDEAKKFLDSMPSVEQLMPQITLDEMEKKLPLASGQYQLANDDEDD